MEERQLKIISILGSVVTLIAIYMFVSFIPVGDVKIGDITRDYSGKMVLVTGMVKNLNVKDGNAFFTLVDDTGEIRVVIWKDILLELETKGVDFEALEENVTVSVEGSVDVYKGQLEIVLTRPRISIIGE
jgi:exonuclease VII large subunit